MTTAVATRSALLVDVFVPGKPTTKGSMDFVPTGAMCKCSPKCKGRLPGGRAVQNVAGSTQWAQLVAYAIKAEMRRTHGDPDLFAWAGPVTVALVFGLPVADVIAPRSGDVDKLVRNVLDALTKGGAYVDDVQVVRLLADKVAMGPMGRKGVQIRVWSGRVR